MQYVELNQNNFILSGYTSQEDIFIVNINGDLYKTLKVFAKDEKVHTYYFPLEYSYILDIIINESSTMTRLGKVIGSGKVKGVCTVIGYEVNNDEVVVNQVLFFPRHIPQRITQAMKETYLQEGPVVRVSGIVSQKSNKSTKRK
ncbi:unnamed protein product [Cunninghamella echinulata]